VFGLTSINLFSISLKYSNVLIPLSLHEQANEYIKADLLAPLWLPENREFLLLRLIYLFCLSIRLSKSFDNLIYPNLNIIQTFLTNNFKTAA